MTLSTLPGQPNAEVCFCRFRSAAAAFREAARADQQLAKLSMADLFRDLLAELCRPSLPHNFTPASPDQIYRKLATINQVLCHC